MSCLRSFNLRVSLTRDQTGTSIKTWTSGTENFWSLNSQGVSTVNIQGYKNINIYGVDVIGNLSTNTTSAINGVIVNDWTVNVFINGVNPIIDAVVTTSPNNYSIINSTTANNIFALGKTPTKKPVFCFIVLHMPLFCGALELHRNGIKNHIRWEKSLHQCQSRGH